MKIICVGLNYQSHNQEMKRFTPTEQEPVLFMKPESALLKDNKPFYIPDFSNEIHYECEVVVKISKLGKNIAERFAHRYYQEVTLGIDFTARDLQQTLKEKGLPWELSKAFDNSAVVGKFIEKDASENYLQNIDFDLSLNGQIVQAANTCEMIHPIDRIVSFASKYFTLKTGDLIFTGTPAGVGKVSIGDHLEGRLENQVLLDFHIH